MLVAILIAVTVVSAIICWVLAKRRHANPVYWSAMGILFGPFAIPFAMRAKAKQSARRLSEGNH